MEVERVFPEEIEAAGGEIQEGCRYQEQLFLRALLPKEEEVTTGDRVRAGVAVRTGRRKIRVNPYVLRNICRNGFIAARFSDTAFDRAIAQLGFNRLLDVVATVGFYTAASLNVNVFEIEPFAEFPVSLAP